MKTCSVLILILLSTLNDQVTGEIQTEPSTTSNPGDSSEKPLAPAQSAPNETGSADNSPEKSRIDAPKSDQSDDDIKSGIELLSRSSVMKSENLKILNEFQDFFLNSYSLKTNLHKLDEMQAKFIDTGLEEEGILELRKANQTDEYVPGSDEARNAKTAGTTKTTSYRASRTCPNRSCPISKKTNFWTRPSETGENSWASCSTPSRESQRTCLPSSRSSSTTRGTPSSST